MPQRIIFQREDGGISVIVPAVGVDINDCVKDVPPGATYEIVDTATIPATRTFRDAWAHDPVSKITVDMTKAKTIAHDMRRKARITEFAPHDDIIAKKIPGADLVAEEAAREAIRVKYATIQTGIDDCPSVEALSAIVEALVSH